MLRIAVILGFIALELGSVNARAAPCAGFTDVEISSTFCPNVDWLKNRQITLGCGANTYCPNDYVTRLQMAAFMNRLGVAFTPLVLSAQQKALNPTYGQVICVTPDVPITDFRRFVSAISTVTFAGLPGLAQYVGARNVFSQDGGQTWQSFNVTDPQQLDVAWNLIEAGGLASVTPLGNERAIFATTFRFGVEVYFSTAIPQAYCQLRASITNRNGTNSPY